jgi:hypothetical protein
MSKFKGESKIDTKDYERGFFKRSFEFYVLSFKFETWVGTQVAKGGRL